MTRDEVLEEFRSDACENECDATDCIVERAMADEIVRLRQEVARLDNTVIALSEESRMMRKEFAEVRAERDAEKQRRREIDDEAFVYAEQVEVMRRRAGRAERTLAALREPSEAFIDAVVRFGYSHFHGMPIQPASFLRAAVAAAEKEASGA